MNRQPAVLVDMDGTLCDVSSVIHLQAEPDGFTAFHEGCAQCPPNRAVVDWCLDHHSRGHEILVVTGRDAWARGLTDQWLSEHLPVPIGGLYMRGDGDFRSNVDVKREIHGRLAMTYDIRAAIDDDPQIVVMWQEIGIPVTMVLLWGEEPVADLENQLFIPDLAPTTSDVLTVLIADPRHSRNVLTGTHGEHDGGVDGEDVRV